jgi:hypothetical protein
MSQLYINQNTPETFNIWVWSCSHLNADLAQGENNITRAISQFLDLELTFDLSLCCGDFDSNQTPPTIAGNASEGAAVVSALDNLTDIGLTQSGLYRISGNHDTGIGETGWFTRYIDPLGVNTGFSNVDENARPYPVTLMEAGSWHSYYVTFGKHLVLCLGDRNDFPEPYGRSGSPAGGYPSGAISLETWEWAKTVILTNKDKNIIVMTHQNPRNTTIGTGDGDGSIGIGTLENLHGESGIALGSGSLYSIYDEDLTTADSPTTQFVDFLKDNPGHTVVAWFAGHSHSDLAEVLNGRGESLDAFGVKFINVGHLTRYHIGAGRQPCDSMSKIFEFSNTKLIVKHFNHQIIGANPIGFYAPLEHSIDLKV